MLSTGGAGFLPCASQAFTAFAFLSITHAIKQYIDFRRQNREYRSEHKQKEKNKRIQNARPAG